MQKRWIGVITAAALLAAGVAHAQHVGEAVAGFTQAHSDIGLYYAEDGRLARVWGGAFSTGATPLESANAFVRDHAAMLANGVGQLIATPLDPDVGLEHPMMWQADRNDFKFHIVLFEQRLNGLPVFRSGMKAVLRNEPGHPMVLASVNLRDLQGAQFPDAAGQGDARLSNRALRSIRRALGAEPQIVDGPRYVIWAGYDEIAGQPTLAIEATAEVATVFDPNYQKKLFVLDAASGDILYIEDQVHNIDITGNVSGMATETLGADICGPESIATLPYAEARVVGGNTTFADASGNFTIPHGGTTQVTVESRLRGQWFEVFDDTTGLTPVLSQMVVPPGPANFTHNAANSSEFERSNVNCYLHANIVRDHLLSYEPAFPTIPNQQFFDINTNLNSTCNAFYNGSSINFYRAGGGCANTGFDTVVYHEYGHHIVNRAGSGQGAYGEGYSDCVGVVITDVSLLARGFQGNCNGGLRDANNNCQYQTSGCSSCGSAIHSCGRLLSGCVWSLRNELLAIDPVNYRDILATLTYGSVLLRSPGDSSITPTITIDFLTVDDTDGNISNGTPHYQQIDAAFSAHNMPAPPLSLIAFEYPSGRPETINPGGGTSFIVEVVGIGGAPQPGTGVLHVDTGSGFTQIPMDEITDNLYEATFPASACGTVVKYFVSAETSTAVTVTDPPNAPTGFFTAISAGGTGVVFEDNFETNKGWTVQNTSLTDGAWQRGVPVPEGPQRGAPGADFDGSGQCYLTANRSGNSDVDGGPTRLISPVLDMSGSGEAFVSYARWHYNDDGDGDRLDVHISNDDGATWVLVESVPGDTSGPTWKTRAFRVSDFIAQTSTMRLRFSATDNPNNSITEAAIDAIRIDGITCGSTQLTGVSITFGSLISGGLPEILTSDDLRLRARSSFGFSSAEANLIVMRVDAATTVSSPATLDISHEARISQSGGNARWRLRNWGTNDTTQVHSHSIGTTETVFSANGIPAANYVRSSDGAIDLRVRTSVLITFSSAGFDAFTDQVIINAN